MIPPLPYRPLEVRGHGVYDPHTGGFYPFRFVTLFSSGNTTLLPARGGIAYYIHSLNVNVLNGSNTGGSWPSVQVSGYGAASPDVSKYIAAAHALPSDGTTRDRRGVSMIVDVLLAPGTVVSIVHSSNAQYGSTTCVYAEIPTDEGEV